MPAIAVPPLELDALGRMVADACRCEPASAVWLATLLREKTGGNPYFASQFLDALHRDGLLTYSPTDASWLWDPSQVEGRHMTDNVVDMLVVKFGRLPDATRELLEFAACIGGEAGLPTLVLLSGISNLVLLCHKLAAPA